MKTLVNLNEGNFLHKKDLDLVLSKVWTLFFIVKGNTWTWNQFNITKSTKNRFLNKHYSKETEKVKERKKNLKKKEKCLNYVYWLSICLKFQTLVVRKEKRVMNVKILYTKIMPTLGKETKNKLSHLFWFIYWESDH